MRLSEILEWAVQTVNNKKGIYVEITVEKTSKSLRTIKKFKEELNNERH